MLDALIKLQEADKNVLGNLAKRDELTTRLNQLTALLTRGETELHDKQEKLANVEGFYEQKTAELKTDVQRASQSKTKLSAITRQKEYLAAQKELQFLKRANTQKEEEILKLMQAIEEYRTGIAGDEEKLAELRSKLSEEEAAHKATLTELETTIQTQQSERSALAESIPAAMLKRYERILKGRDGLAVVPVSRSSENCLGCNMKLPPQAFIQLLRSEQIMNCPSCQRFIYVGPEESIEEESTETDAGDAEAA